MLFKSGSIKLKKDENDVEYNKVTGFFEFRGEYYYRAKGVAARHLYDEEKSFTDKIKELYPEEFDSITAKEVSVLKVRPLHAVR